MIKRLLGELPTWAKLEHPLLRYELSRQKPHESRSSRRWRVMGEVLLFVLLILGGLVYATLFFTQPAGDNWTRGFWRVFFFPTLILQIILSLSAIYLSVESVNGERRRQTWDNLRVTEVGAEMTLRTRFAAIFYRLRIILITIIVIRVAMIAALLWELTSHRGGYLDLLTATITPEMPLPLNIALLAGFLSAALLLPITQTGLEISLGLLIAAAFRNRTYAVICQMVYVVLRVSIPYVLLLGVTRFMTGELALSEPVAWGLFSSYTAFADQGLLLLQLRDAGEIWALIPYSIFSGILLLVYALAQSALSDFLMALAVKRAELTE